MTRTERSGLAYIFASIIIWGCFPVYFKQLDHIDAVLVIGYRIVTATAALLIVIVVGRRLNATIAILRSAKNLVILFITATILCFSWSLYVWAIINEYVVESSLGYYLTPILSVLLGNVFLNEQLNKWRWISVWLAASGVLFMIALNGTIPWVGIGLGGSFAVYSLIRKGMRVDTLAASFIETIYMLPLGVIVIWLYNDSHTNDIDVLSTIWLAFSGIITLLPIMFYIAACQRLTFATVGTLFYLAPTIGFLCGVFIYAEVFTLAHGIMFSLIWIALIIYSIDSFRSDNPEPSR